MFHRRHRKLTLVVIALVILLLTGCMSWGKKEQLNEAARGAYLTVTDDVGRKVALAHKPDRIVLLSPSFIGILYAVDGKAVGRASSNKAALANTPQEVQELPEVGFVYNVNMEKLLGLRPDLVISYQGINENVVPVLESSGIPVIVLKIRTYEDVRDKVALFGDIAGTPEKSEQVLQSLDSRVNAIIGKLPDRKIKVAILHATAQSVTLERENSLAGSVAKILRLGNIAAGGMPLEGNPDATPYSLEKLLENDPDILFITTMGNSAEIAKRLQADVESNPAWSSLRAVREKKVYFLPDDLFLINPGLHFDEAVSHMARLVYPEIYGTVN